MTNIKKINEIINYMIIKIFDVIIKV